MWLGEGGDCCCDNFDRGKRISAKIANNKDPNSKRAANSPHRRLIFSRYHAKPEPCHAHHRGLGRSCVPCCPYLRAFSLFYGSATRRCFQCFDWTNAHERKQLMPELGRFGAPPPAAAECQMIVRRIIWLLTQSNYS